MYGTPKPKSRAMQRRRQPEGTVAIETLILGWLKRASDGTH
jgi:hypothetical protein